LYFICGLSDVIIKEYLFIYYYLLPRLISKPVVHAVQQRMTDSSLHALPCGSQSKALCEEPLDRDSWRCQCKEAIAKFEASRVTVLDMKRAAHKQFARMLLFGHAVNVHLQNWTPCSPTHSPMMLQSVVFDGAAHDTLFQLMFYSCTYYRQKTASNRMIFFGFSPRRGEPVQIWVKVGRAYSRLVFGDFRLKNPKIANFCDFFAINRYSQN